jgi:hypothetical protein
MCLNCEEIDSYYQRFLQCRKQLKYINSEMLGDNKFFIFGSYLTTNLIDQP